VDVDAGTHIKSVTKVHTISGSDKVVIKGKGGTIILNSSGIILKGNVDIKGNVAITGGSGGGAETLSLVANKADGFCLTCFLKEMGMEV
jgi:type VI secretion system secreted protein VgrG